MKRYYSIVGALCVLAGSFSWAGAKTLWTGQSGGFDFLWTTHDITVSPVANPSKILYSAGRLFQKDNPQAQKSGEPVRVEVEQTLRILSIVGPIMSMETYDYGDYLGTAHPSSYSRYTAIDFRHPNRMARLSDYFAPDEILNVLLQDNLVQKQLAGKKPASTLDRLVRQLADSHIDLASCDYRFDEDLLSRFAFHQIQGGKVAVRLGLSYGSEPCRGMLTQIGLWLPIPEALRSALAKAGNRQEGFLMDAQGIKESLNASDPKVVHNQATFLSIKGPAHRD